MGGGGALLPVSRGWGTDGPMTSVLGRVRLSLLWWGLPASVALFALLRSDPGRSIVFAASQVVFLAVAWLSAATMVAVWRSKDDRIGRRTWGLLAVASCAIAAGETVLSWYQVVVDVRGPTGFTIADALNAVGAAAFLLALISLYASSRPSRFASARRVFDVIGLLAVSYAAVNAVLWMSRGVALGAEGTALETAYVHVGLVILGASLLNAFGRTGGFDRPPSRVLAAGLALYGSAVMLWPLWYAFLRDSGTQSAEIALAILFMVSYYVIFMAGVYELRTPATVGPVAGTEVPPGIPESMPYSALAPTVLLVAIPLLGVSAVRAGPGSEPAVVNLVTMVIAGTALAVRTVIDAVESGQLRSRAGTDPMTGLSDLPTLSARLGDSVRLWERYGQPVSVIVIDLVGLGRLNTLYGRAEGDRIVKAFAAALREVAGQDCTVGRLGSDEFAVILDGVGAERAPSRAEEMRSAIAEVATSTGLPIIASWGVATCPQDSTRSRDLITKAYAAQNWAKAHDMGSVVPYAAETIDVFDASARATSVEERMELEVLLAVAMALEERHPATRYHSRNVSALSARVAERLGMPLLGVCDVEFAALLHDIGKTSLPDEVLTKRGPRSRAEEARYREHPVIGARIVEASALRRVAPAVRAHHERWDGSGYPDGLAGTDIPLAARIVGACDAFECMVAGRPDRPPLSMAAALQDLDQNLGAAYDPDVVEALLAVCAESPIDESAYRSDAL